MAKDKTNRSGIVYSTDPQFKGFDQDDAEQPVSVSAQEQKLRVRLETKHRAGKAVTLLEGLLILDGDIACHEKLKTFCGTGGSVKDGEILIQGDNRDKVLQWLLKNGFKNAKKI